MSEKQSKGLFLILILSTKKYHIWQFVLKDKHHKVEIFHSVLTGKKKITLDGNTLTEDQR